MIDIFEQIRGELHMAIDEYGINSKNVIEISEEFNRALNLYYEKELKYSEDNIMRIKYKEAIETLKNITKDFAKYPTINEWNKYAKEKCLLSSESLKYISGMNWHDLRSKIKIEVNNK